MNGITNAKQYDMDARISVLEMMALSLRLYQKTHTAQFFELARQLGAQSKALETKIKTHDYAQDEARFLKVNSMIKKWNNHE